jgi:hypothetical protein
MSLSLRPECSAMHPGRQAGTHAGEQRLAPSRGAPTSVSAVRRSASTMSRLGRPASSWWARGAGGGGEGENSALVHHACARSSTLPVRFEPQILTRHPSPLEPPTPHRPSPRPRTCLHDGVRVVVRGEEVELGGAATQQQRGAVVGPAGGRAGRERGAGSHGAVRRGRVAERATPLFCACGPCAHARRLLLSGGSKRCPLSASRPPLPLTSPPAQM